MSLFYGLTALFALSAVFGYLNILYFHLPRRIGLMIGALVISLGLILAGHVYSPVAEAASGLLTRIQFQDILFNGILCFLLFSGALGVNLEELLQQKWTILTLSTVGVLISTAVIGATAFHVFRWLGAPVPFLFCLLFGALISPTDPVAVLGILLDAGLPKTLEIKIAGEALFNDGVGVVLFTILLGAVTGRGELTATAFITAFIREALGGVMIGIVTGWIAFQMLKRIDAYAVEIMITIALAMGCYALASLAGTSGPLASIASGLLIGNHGRAFAMSPETCRNLDTFWELADEIMNTVLFFLIGFEVLALKALVSFVGIATAMIPLSVFGRWVSVAVPLAVLRLGRSFSPHAVKILTWGGLRGGIPLALALLLPQSPWRGLLIASTYAVVVFSILVQGLTIEPIVRRWRES